MFGISYDKIVGRNTADKREIAAIAANFLAAMEEYGPIGTGAELPQEFDPAHLIVTDDGYILSRQPIRTSIDGIKGSARVSRVAIQDLQARILAAGFTKVDDTNTWPIGTALYERDAGSRVPQLERLLPQLSGVLSKKERIKLTTNMYN